MRRDLHTQTCKQGGIGHFLGYLATDIGLTSKIGKLGDFGLILRVANACVEIHAPKPVSKGGFGHFLGYLATDTGLTSKIGKLGDFGLILRVADVCKAI